MNKIIKNLLFIFIIVLFCGCEPEKIKSEEENLFTCLSIRYWVVDLGSHNAQKSDSYIFLDFVNQEKTLFSKKLVALSELTTTKITIVLQRQINDYVLYICNNKTAYATSLNKDFFYMPLLSFNQTKLLNLNDYIVKADNKIIENDFSRLYDTETGIKLDIRSK